ncbi:MAG: EAL domain-containing protein [Methylococcaceae bacterium]|nr:EAL domain-containing protein [Methylococcaceae bacterium]
MEDNRSFFSLRWKLAILFGCVFLIMHSAFSYIMYLEAKEHYADERKHVEDSHVNIAKALTEESYTVLEQFAELLSLIDTLSTQQENYQIQVLSTLDENWSQWQLSWDMENVAFFDKQAVRVKSWGNEQITADAAVKQVLSNEAPAHQVFCTDNCYQQAIIPLMRKSEISGAFSVLRTFSDVILKYKLATSSDIGVVSAQAESVSDGQNIVYKLTGMTSPEKNQPIFDYIARHHTFSEFIGASKTLELGGRVYDVTFFPVQANTSEKGPYFLLVNDITPDVIRLDKELQQVWIYGVISLSGSLILLILLLHVSFRRVKVLSELLPLLSQNQYAEFKRQLTTKKNSPTFGRDELDELNCTVLSLTHQLETLEQDVRNNTFTLLEKSQDLAKERDFIRQLVDTAPIIIITQKLNGIILSVNQAGIDKLEADSHSIVGKVFDMFVPESDQEHLKKLNQLRMGDRSKRFNIDGYLVTQSGKQKETSWLHTLLKSEENSDEPVILSLGVDISSRAISEEKTQKMSSYDYLTGLINRKKFKEELSVELASAKRYGYKIALFYLDLDQFKTINDNKDFEVGDYLLQQVATVLKDAMRSTDLLCRYGGDEFTLIMPHAELQGIQQNATKINQMLLSNEFCYDGVSYPISISIGISIFPQHGLTVSELLENAELAMHQAKISGGATYHIFSPDHSYQTKLTQMLYWQEVIENAIAQDKFVLYYQPVIQIQTNEINHFECLLRLQKEDGSLILPPEFIGYAEQLDLIGKIDRWVIKKAVQKLIEYRRLNEPFKLSINLSTSALDDPAMFEDISRLISVPDLDPSQIIFEITEAAAVSNFAAAETLIKQLKELGCLLALDDFGVGFSSIYYLNHFPVDFIKLDGSFISQIDKNDDDKIFVKAITGLAHAYNKQVVAEFVENEEILAILNDFGVDFAQGHYLAHPTAHD